MNNAFELDAMDDKTNLLAVVFSPSRGCSSSIGFLLGIPKHAYGARSFSLYGFDELGLPVFPGIPVQLFGTTSWSIWNCVWKTTKRWSGHTGERAVSTSLLGSRPTFNLGANV